VLIRLRCASHAGREPDVHRAYYCRTRRYGYLQNRVVSTLKVRGEQFEKLLSPEKPESKWVELTWFGQVCMRIAQCSHTQACACGVPHICRAPIQKFLDTPEAMRLMFYMDGKELAVVSASPTFKSKKARTMCQSTKLCLFTVQPACFVLMPCQSTCKRITISGPLASAPRQVCTLPS